MILNYSQAVLNIHISTMVLQSQHSKGRELYYEKQRMSEYLKNPELTLNESKMIFKIRSRSLEFTSNYKTKYQPQHDDSPNNNLLLCHLCECHEDKQEELITCSALSTVSYTHLTLPTKA